jgi:hypothetical protein
MNVIFSAGTPASLSCGSVTLDDPGSPGGRYPGSAPCTSPAHTMEHHHHHHTHHSHQGLSGIGRPTSRQDTLSPATSVASSPSPPPTGQRNNSTKGVVGGTTVVQVNGTRHSESCSNLPTRLSDSQNSINTKQPQYSSSYPEQATSSHDDISHDSYDLLRAESEEEEQVVYKPHRIIGRTRSDPARQEKCEEGKQLRMAKSEPSHSLDRDSRQDDEDTQSDQFKFDDQQEDSEPFYANQIMENRFRESSDRFREGGERFCSHCRSDLDQPLVGSKFASVRSEPMLCQGTSRMYSDDDSSDQYVDARVERIPSDEDGGGDEIPSSCSSPEIFPMEEPALSPKPFPVNNGRYPSNRLPSPTNKTIFYFPDPGEQIQSPRRQENNFFAQELPPIPPYSPRQPLMPEPSIKSPRERDGKSFAQESRPLKSPPPPSHPNSPRQMLSPRQLLSPRGAEASPRSPTRKFFPPEGIKSPTSPRQSLFPPQDSDPSPLRSPPPILSPKILTHQASIDLHDECDLSDFKSEETKVLSPVPGNDLDYVLHKRHLQQSDSGSGSESSSDHRSRRAAPRRRALNNHQGGQGNSRSPIPLFARGPLEQRRQQRAKAGGGGPGGPKPLDVVALHRLPPMTAFSSNDDTVDTSAKEAIGVNIEQRRTDIHGLKMAFLLSGVEEEEPRTIDSSRVVISDEEDRSFQSRVQIYTQLEEETPETSENEQQYADELQFEKLEEEIVPEIEEIFKTPSPPQDSSRKSSLSRMLSCDELDETPTEILSPEVNADEQPPRRASLSRVKSMSEESDDTETARTVVTPRHTARKASLCRTASISEDSDACLGSDTGRKNKMASDDSDLETKPPEKTVDVKEESAAAELSRTLEERRRVLMASSEDDSDHPAAPASIDSSRVTLETGTKTPSLSDESRQDSVSELEKALIRALMRTSSTDDEALSRQTSIDRVIMETTDPAELEKILIRAIMRGASTEENPSRQSSIERVVPTSEVTDPSELEKALIRALMRNSSTEDEQSSSGTRQASIDSSRITVETQPSSICGDSSISSERDDDPAELEKALIRALMRNSSTDDEFSRQTSIDSTRVSVETHQSTAQQALELEKVLLRALMKSSSEDEPVKTAAQQNELERFLLDSLVKNECDDDLVFISDKRRASCPMTQLEKDAAEFDSKIDAKPRRASEGGRFQTTEFHHDDFKPRCGTHESMYHSTHDLTKKPQPLALELFESRRRDVPLRRCSYPPSSSEEDEAYVKPRQTRSSYVPSSSEDEEFNPRAGTSKSSLSDHALSRRSHIEGLRRAMLDSSGSSSLEDDNPVFLPSEPPIQGAGPTSVLLEYAVSAAFPPARTLSRISERSTTSEQERSSEEESKLSSPSSDSEATNSEISSGAGRGENSLSSDPSSSDQRPPPEADAKKSKVHSHGTHHKHSNTAPKAPTILLSEEVPEQPQTVTATTYIIPSVSNTSYLETYYMELRPELASPVTLPLDSSSTDDNQPTLQDSPSSTSSRYDLGNEQLSHPDFFTPITCTPPSSAPETPTRCAIQSSSLPSLSVEEETILSPDLPLPPPPPEPSRPSSIDETGWGDELPPPPPDFTSVSPVMKDEEDDVIIQPMEVRRRPFTDPTYEYSGYHTLPRRQKPHGSSSESVPTVISHTLPRRNTKRSSQESVTPSFQGQRVVIPVKPTVSGHHTFPRQRKHRSSHNRDQPGNNTLPRARHRVAVSLEVRRGRVISTDRPCIVVPGTSSTSHITKHSEV